MNEINKEKAKLDRIITISKERERERVLRMIKQRVALITKWGIEFIPIQRSNIILKCMSCLFKPPPFDIQIFPPRPHFPLNFINKP